VKAQFLDHVELAHLHQRHHAGGPPESLRACAPALDELGLAGALVQVTQRLTAGTPLAVDLAVGELSSLPAAMEVAAFRIVTEAVTNAVRHAAASTCRSPSRSPAGCRWSVSDDGRGFDIERAASTSCSWTSTCPHCRASRRPLGSPPCPTRPRCWSSRWSPTTTPSWAAMRRRPRLCPQGRDRRPDRRGGPHARRRRRGLRRRRRTRARADLHGGRAPIPAPSTGSPTRNARCSPCLPRDPATAQIARALGLSVKTVQNFVSRILDKLQVADRTQAALQVCRRRVRKLSSCGFGVSCRLYCSTQV
jgi:Bacterial regulatory proteins, luxR family